MQLHSLVAVEAETLLPELLHRVELGETITLTREGKPVALISPVEVLAPPTNSSVQDAIDELKRLRIGNTLGSLSIRELIEEGRRF